MTGQKRNKVLIKEYGDYQTPVVFVNKVCSYLKNLLKTEADIIFEPNMGLGNFLTESIDVFHNVKKIFGVEINKAYHDYAKNKIYNLIKDKDGTEINLFLDDIFLLDFDKIKKHISKEDKLLIIGNPPWATNSNLSSLGSQNLPLKNNFKGISGLDAMTGKGNFDIAEYIILLLLSEFKNYNCTIAMLCKNIVAKNIVRDLNKYDFNLSNMKMVTFDAKDIFKVSCEAALIIMELGNKKTKICDVYSFNNPLEKIKAFGWVNNKFISDIKNYSQYSYIDGHSQFEWRQGIKHDCSKIMELTLKQKDGTYINGNNEFITIEDDYVYPLLKSSDLKTVVSAKTRKNVIVTQQKVNEKTDIIAEKAPKLWEYLNKNAPFIDRRKSSIYKKAPRFSIFGIGEYSFTPYKVAVSGFYKEPLFSLVTGEKTIMLDDTCYFLGFYNYTDALISTILLNSPSTQNFIKSIAFLDSKRPYTKDILMRIDLLKIAEKTDFKTFLAISEKLQLDNTISENSYMNYIYRLQVSSE